MFDDRMIDDNVLAEDLDVPSFSAENEALAKYSENQTQQAAPESAAPHSYTHKEAQEIAHGVKEASALDPHRGELGKPEPKHHMDHF